MWHPRRGPCLELHCNRIEKICLPREVSLLHETKQLRENPSEFLGNEFVSFLGVGEERGKF